MKVGLNPMVSIFVRRGNTHTDMHKEEGYMKPEAENGGKHQYIKEC